MPGSDVSDDAHGFDMFVGGSLWVQP